MADQEDQDAKTEEATPRRRSEARDKGQVALSSEVVAAVGLCVGMFSILAAGPRLAEAIARGAVSTFESLPSLGKMEMTVPLGTALMSESLTSVLGALALVTIPSILLSALAGYLQVGFKLTPKAVEFKLSKFDLVKGAKGFVSMRSVMRTLLSSLKVILITVVVSVIAWSNVEGIIRTSTNELGPLMISVGHVAVRCVIGALIVILVLSLVDLVFQRFQQERDLRMSKKELKEESKQMEGDPKVKARIRQIQYEIATRRMMSDVPDATVVVTNPTHFALGHHDRGAARLLVQREEDRTRDLAVQTVHREGVEPLLGQHLGQRTPPRARHAQGRRRERARSELRTCPRR